MKKLALFLIVVLYFSSCSNQEVKETELSEKLDSIAPDSSEMKKMDEEKEFKFFMIIANIPSPSHEVVELGKQNQSFKKEVPNNTKNVDNYTDSYKTAINYGVYIADFAYVSAFKNNKEIFNYFAACRKMAEKATVLKTFEEVVKSDFIKYNASNPDALEKILDTLYVNTEKFLETDHHLDIAVKILLGSWVETQYVFLSHLKEVNNNDKNKALFTKLWENKNHLNHINELLTEYSGHEELNSLAGSLSSYQKNYEGISAEKDFTKEKILKMYEDLSTIRSEMIK